MNRNPEIRDGGSFDLPALETLYPQAFPDEDLLPLLCALLADVPDLLSLVATIDSRVVGHVLFTPCRDRGNDAGCALLAPLAVSPAWQRRGVGSSLVRAGLQRLKAEGTSHVFVLGDPAFYGRLGFRQELRVLPPYALPDEWATAWQSLLLGPAPAAAAGKLRLPQPWMDPALWMP